MNLRIHPDELRAFVCELFVSAGMFRPDAIAVAEVLVEDLPADARALGDVADRDAFHPALLDELERRPAQPVTHARGARIGAVGPGGRPQSLVR